MEQIIERIYETAQVTGRNGEVHTLTSAIDRREGDFLFSTIHNDHSIVKTLEVGCAYGLSSLCICTATRGRAGASHTIIDPFETTYWDGAGIRNLEEARIDFFDLIEDKSEVGLPRMLPDMECQFDFIFVDGFHTFDYTLVDCFYATRLLRIGGYLVIDDVSFPSVRRVVDFLKNYPCYEEHGAVAEKRPKSWKSMVARILLSPVPRGVWTKILSPGLFRRIFDDQNVSMVALKKIAEDTRNWDWHNDAF